MTCKGSRVEPDTGRVRLDDVGGATVGQSCGLDALALGDRPENRPFGDGGGFEPRL
jgi:hypothetical protein